LIVLYFWYWYWYISRKFARPGFQSFNAIS